MDAVLSKEAAKFQSEMPPCSARQQLPSHFFFFLLLRDSQSIVSYFRDVWKNIRHYFLNLLGRRKRVYSDERYEVQSG